MKKEKTCRDLLYLIAETIALLRKQFFHNSGEKIQLIVKEMQDMLSELTKKYSENITEIEEVLQQCIRAIGGIIDALEKTDYILCADLLETELYPLAVVLVGETEEEYKEDMNCGRYRLEKSDAGDFTIKTTGEEEFYLHSRVNPRMEAKQWIEGILEPGKDAYVVWGLGLGYHIEALYQIVAGRSKIQVFEPDKELIRLAGIYGRMKDLPADTVEVIYDGEGMAFAEAGRQENIQVIMHYPSVRNIQNAKIRSAFSQLFISDSSIKETKTSLYMNFRSNTSVCKHSADEILNRLEQKKVVVVAAGPSLDKNISLLKKENRDFLIIAVGTVFGKLVRMGIQPDYVVFMDAQERTFRQLEDLLPLKLNVPIVVESTACWKFMKYYQGPKFIAYQKGYELAEEAAAKGECTLFETGGTVTSLALDMAIKGHAKTIICIGVDLSYTGGMTHAGDTMDYAEAEENETLEVPGWYGGTVRTKMIFDMYRQWIENRIANCKEDITFINATEGGVFIKGMIHEPLECAMQRE